MFVPKFSITNKVLKNIGIVEACREVIINAPLVPAWEIKFRKEAMERTVHHGTHLEGNQLSEEEVKEVLEGGEVIARDRDIQEIINYRNVLKFIDQIQSQVGPSEYNFTLETILEIHRLTTEKILPEGSAGQFRARQVVVKNSKTGQISYTPPPAIEVSYLIEDLVDWINSDDGKEVHPIIKAGIIHYEIARIHPQRISVDAKVKDKLGGQVMLNERQMTIMEFLHRHKSMQNKDFRKMFPDFSDDTVLRELKFLKTKGLVKKIGGTKKATYILK